MDRRPRAADCDGRLPSTDFDRGAVHLSRRWLSAVSAGAVWACKEKFKNNRSRPGLPLQVPRVESSWASRQSMLPGRDGLGASQRCARFVQEADCDECNLGTRVGPLPECGATLGWARVRRDFARRRCGWFTWQNVFVLRAF